MGGCLLCPTLPSPRDSLQRWENTAVACYNIKLATWSGQCWVLCPSCEPQPVPRASVAPPAASQGVTWGPGADPGPVVLPHPGRGWDTARTSAVSTQFCLHLCMEMRVVSDSAVERPGHSLGKRNNRAGQRQRGGDGVMHPHVPPTGRSLQLRAHGHVWLGGCVLMSAYLRVLCVLSGLGTQGPKFSSELWKAGVRPSCLHGIDVVRSPSNCPHRVQMGHSAECSDDVWGRAKGLSQLQLCQTCFHIGQKPPGAELGTSRGATRPHQPAACPPNSLLAALLHTGPPITHQRNAAC